MFFYIQFLNVEVLVWEILILELLIKKALTSNTGWFSKFNVLTFFNYFFGDDAIHQTKIS